MRFLSLCNLLAVTLLLMTFSLGRTPSSFCVLTVAVPALDIPLPVQMVLAYGWQVRMSEYAIGQAWWTLGGWGITFLVEAERYHELQEAVPKEWQQVKWGVLTVRQARWLATQELQRWQREPMVWLQWQARTFAIGQPLLVPDQTLQVRLDEVEAAHTRLVRREPLLLLSPSSSRCEFTVLSRNPMPLPSPRRPLRISFRREFRHPDSQRAHALWWLVTDSDQVVAWVLGEWLGGGTGARWFQLLRGDQPLAYHALAQVQLTPLGTELSLYSASMPSHLPVVQQRARALWTDLLNGRISADELERAKRLAELRYHQLIADPLKAHQAVACWLMAGKPAKAWQQLPERFRTLQLSAVKSFCRTLPSAAELVMRP